jgi:hypothetical protein
MIVTEYNYAQSRIALVIVVDGGGGGGGGGYLIGQSESSSLQLSLAFLSCYPPTLPLSFAVEPLSPKSPAASR